MQESISVRTAVVGCGYWGKNLVRNFHQLSSLKVCCDASESIRSRLKKEYPAVRVTDDFSSVINDHTVDAVVIATPAISHAELAVAALQAGKHVFVEKPLALSVGDAERVVAAAEQAGRFLMVGHLLQYHPAVEYLKTMITRGDLGEVYYCYAQRVNLGKLRQDENALWSLAPHDISVILYLMDEEPEEVEASGQAFLQPGIEDVVFLTMKFGSGRVAHVQVSWLDPHKERRLTVVGSKKMVVFDDMEPQEKIRIYDKGVERRPTEAASYTSYAELLMLRDGDVHIPRLPSQEPLSIECKHFVESIATGVAPKTDGENGLRVVRVLETANDRLQADRLAYRSPLL